MSKDSILKSIWSFFYTKDESAMDALTEEQYLEIFIKGRSKEEIEKSYNKAWEARNFEIELYWKRANYFWAFQIASFAGYFTVLNSKAYSDNPQVLYFVICIGFVTSLAWAFTNIGSKMWQRHWEIHVDMLENSITGPLYKIMTSVKTFSLTKINEIVSKFIVTIWAILIFKYFCEHVTFIYSKGCEVDYQVWISSIAVIYFVGAMVNGHGRGRFGHRRVKFYKRKFSTEN